MSKKQQIIETCCNEWNKLKSNKKASYVQFTIDHIINLFEEIEQKDQQIAELEKQLAELKEKAIVPKFNFGDTIFAVVIYIADPKDKTVIESGIVQKIECDKNQIKYWCDNGRIYWEDECEKLFATKAEAEKALKEQK